jgi:hypothetical protein
VTPDQNNFKLKVSGLKFLNDEASWAMDDLICNALNRALLCRLADALDEKAEGIAASCGKCKPAFNRT